MSKGLKVVKPSAFASIQDLGRYRYRHLGVPVSGALDQSSVQLANLILGNELEAAALEIIVGGGKYQFLKPTKFVLTGGDLGATMNEQNLAMQRIYFANNGDELIFKKPYYGNVTYLAVSGGFDAPSVLGSRSYAPYLTSSQKLSPGDEIEYMASVDQIHPYARVKVTMSMFSGEEIDVIPGQDFDQLTRDLSHETFTLSSSSSRQAYQFDEKINHFKYKEIITTAVSPGNVQLTPSGNLIVLMRDGQTTGGYPIVLRLTDDAINKLAQKSVGQKVRFRVT